MKTEQHGLRYMSENRTVVVTLRKIELSHETAEADRQVEIEMFHQYCLCCHFA